MPNNYFLCFVNERFNLPRNCSILIHIVALNFNPSIGKENKDFCEHPAGIHT